MRVWLWLVVAGASIGIAHAARTLATSKIADDYVSTPYAPSTQAAPYVSLGYREALSDMLFVRLRGYFGDVDSDPVVITDLCDAVITLDPRFHRAYGYCAGAISFFALTSRRHGTQALYLRAIAMLERGIGEFPQDWHLANLAAQIYTQDLVTDDPVQRREWDEKGVALAESAIRKPGAPAQVADWVAVMRTKFGQQQRAIRELEEVLLLTTDSSAREALIERLSALKHENADEVAGEILHSRREFDRAWRRDRGDIPPTWYVLLGARVSPGFDPTDLATGGRELVIPEPDEKLEPVE